MDSGVHLSKVYRTNEGGKPKQRIGYFFSRRELTALSITNSSVNSVQHHVVGPPAVVPHQSSELVPAAGKLASCRDDSQGVTSERKACSAAHFPLPPSWFLCPLNKHCSGWEKDLLAFSWQIILPPQWKSFVEHSHETQIVIL